MIYFSKIQWVSFATNSCQLQGNFLTNSVSKHVVRLELGSLEVQNSSHCSGQSTTTENFVDGKRFYSSAGACVVLLAADVVRSALRVTSRLYSVIWAPSSSLASWEPLTFLTLKLVSRTVERPGELVRSWHSAKPMLLNSSPPWFPVNPSALDGGRNAGIEPSGYHNVWLITPDLS